MSNTPNSRSIFNLAWPIALNAILLQCILIIDTVLVTPLGEEPLAAMGLAASTGGLILGFLFAFSNGTQMLLAQAYGAENPLALKSFFWAGQTINWITAILGIALIAFFGNTFLTAIASSEALASRAHEYLLIFSGVIVGVSICQNITVFFNATGNSKLPFYSNIIEMPFNIALSWALIHGHWGLPQLGLPGAAWGSAIAVGIRTLFLICCLIVTKQQHLLLSGWSQGKFINTLHEHFRRSKHIAATFISMSITFNVCMMIYANLSINQFAAMTLIFPWIRVAGHITTAWAQSTGIIVGQMLGKQQWQKLDDFISTSWRVSFFISALVAITYCLMFFLFEAIYPDLQAETINNLWSLLPVVILLPLIRSSNTMCGHVLRAGGDVAYVFRCHVFTQWLLTVPLALLFVIVWDVPLVWVLGITLIEEIVKSVPFHKRMWSGAWKRHLVTS